MVQRISEMRQSGLLPPEEPPVRDMTTSAYDLAQEQVGKAFSDELPPEKFGVENLYNNLRQGIAVDGSPLTKIEDGVEIEIGPFTENDALDAIAQRLLVRDGYDVETAKQKVRSRERLPEDIILDLTPTKDRNVIGAFFEGLGREGVASFAGIEAATALTPKAYAAAQPTRAVPYVGFVLPEAIGLTTAVSSYLLASGATQEVTDFLIPEAPYLPEDVPFRKAGEAAGAGLGAVRRSKDILLALPQQVELGSTRVLENLSQNRILGAVQKAYGRAARTLEQGIPALRREALETPGLITKTELATIPGVTGAGGLAAEMDPGDTSTAVFSEIGGSIINIPRMVMGSLGLLNKAKDQLILGIGSFLPDKFGGDRAAETQKQRGAEWLVGFLNEVGKISGEIQPDLLVDYSKQNPFFGPEGQAFDFESFVAGYRTPEGAFDSENFFEALGQQGLVDSTGQTISVDEVLRNSGAAGEFDARSVLEYLQNNQIIGVDGQPVEGLELMISDLVPEAARPAMRALENSFINASGRLSSEVADANRRSLQGLSTAIKTLEDTGNPDALRAAAALRNNMYQVLLQGRVEARINKAIETAQKATGDAGFDARVFVGQEIKRITEEALLDARALEKTMYDRVDFNTPVDIDNFFQRYLEIEGNDLLPEEMIELDLITRQVFERFTENPRAEELENIAATAVALGNKRRTALLGASKADSAIETLLIKSPDLETKFLELRDAFENPLVSELMGTEGRQIASFAEGFDSLSELQQLQRMRGIANTKGSDFSQLKPLIDRRIDSLTKKQTADSLGQQLLSYDTYQSVNTAGPVSQPARLRDLQLLRSRLLDAARNQEQGTNFRRIYGELAESIRDDISVLADGVEGRELAGEALSKSEKSLLEAHRFSKSFNDVFRRTFAGDVLDETASGASKIPVEELADRLYTGGVGRVNRLFESLVEAASFEGDKGAKEAAGRVTSIEGAYGVLLQTLANRVLKPRMIVKPDGTRVQEMVVDQAALRNLTNPETPLGSLLQRPELAALRQDLTVLGPDGAPVDDVLLEAGRTANLLLSYRQGRRGPLTNSQEDVRHSLLADILKVDSPVRLVDRALNDADNPAKAFKNLVNQVNRLGGRAVVTPKQRARLKELGIEAEANIPPTELIREAKQGLRSSVFYWAFGNAQTADGFLSPAKIRRSLFEPLGKDQPTVAKMMIDDGVISEEEIKRLDTLLTRMANVEQRYQRGASLDELMDEDSAVTNFTLRVIGARMASQFVPGQGGQIQVPAAGASLMQQMFGKMPMLGTRNAITEAIKPGNEEVFASLLRRGLNKPENAAANRETMQSIDAFLVRTLGMSPVTGAVVAQELRPIDRPAEREFISPVQDQTPQVREAEENKQARQAQQQASLNEFVETQNRLEAERQAQQPPPPPQPQPAPVAAPPQASLAPQSNTQSLQRAVQVLGMDDEIGGLASEMLMRQRPS